jgi:predicted secreted protein
MVATAGRLLIIKYDSGAGMAIIAGARTDSFTVSNEPINITDKADAGVQTLLDDIGTQSLSMSIEGVVKDTVLKDLAFGAGTGSAIHNFAIFVSGTSEITAADGFFISSYQENGVEGTDPVTFTCELTASGAITVA